MKDSEDIIIIKAYFQCQVSSGCEACGMFPQQFMDNSPLPSGWITQFDPRYNRNYFVNTATGKSQWEDPRTPQGPPPAYTPIASELKPSAPQPYTQQQPFYVQPINSSGQTRNIQYPGVQYQQPVYIQQPAVVLQQQPAVVIQQQPVYASPYQSYQTSSGRFMSNGTGNVLAGAAAGAGGWSGWHHHRPVSRLHVCWSGLAG